MDKEEASRLMSEKLDQAYALIKECIVISDESDVAFELPWGGEGSSESGLGGSYYPTTTRWYFQGWNPSSQSC